MLIIVVILAVPGLLSVDTVRVATLVSSAVSNNVNFALWTLTKVDFITLIYLALILRR